MGGRRRRRDRKRKVSLSEKMTAVIERLRRFFVKEFKG